jgi:ubiquinone/menaquinone biosynthesis C-methylase UbiE
MTEALYTDGATGYDQMFGRVTQAFIPVLLDAARAATGQSILDVATGTGAAARAARDRTGPGGEVIAGDISATMLDIARRNPENVGIAFEQFDGHKLPYADARFDRVICQLGLAFFEDPGRGLAEFRRVLKPGGRGAVIVNSTPERSLFTRIGTVIGQQVPELAEKLNRYASIRAAERLRHLFSSGVSATLRSARRPARFRCPRGTEDRIAIKELALLCQRDRDIDDGAVAGCRKMPPTAHGIENGISIESLG